MTSLQLATADDVFDNIFQSVSDNVDGDAIENLVNRFTSALQNVADPLFGKYIKTAYHIQLNFKCHPSWMNDNYLELPTECYRLIEGLFNCQNPRDKGPPEFNSARG